MVNLTHFRVLLKKNFQTLRRKWGFAVIFVVLPLVMMGIFTGIQSAVSNGERPEGHNFDQLFFTTNKLPKNVTLPDNQWTLELNFSNTDIDIKHGNNLPLICNLTGNNKYAMVGTPENIAKFALLELVLNNTGFEGEHHQDTTELYDKIRMDGDPKYCFGLQIDEFDSETDNYDIKMMFLRKNLPDTLRPAYDQSIRTPDYMHWDLYKNSGFLHMYSLIAGTIIRNKGTFQFTNGSSIDVAYMPMKTPLYEDIPPIAIDGLSQNFPFYFMVTFLIPMYYLVQKLAEEKESKSREGMKMMGLKDSAYFLSWYVFFLVIVIVMSLLVTMMLSINVLRDTNKLFIFAASFFFGMSLFGFSLVIVSILPTVRAAATAATLVHLISYFMVFALKDPDLPAQLKTGLSIFPNVGMFFCFFNLYRSETQQGGLNFSNVGQWYNNTSFLYSLIMLVIATFFYLALGLYLDQILQSQFGVAKKWYFLCTRKFWCSGKKRRGADGNHVSSSSDQPYQNCLLNNCEGDEEDVIKKRNPEDFETVPEVLRRQELTRECLKISGLRKEFGSKVAVDNSHITMYNGQIFALLGHNGAGKTTTISMLTGLLEASRGRASVFDLNIFEDMDEFRKILGVCPQHDVLFEFLTPREHLELFAAFKGTPRSQIPGQVDKMIRDIDLIEAENQLAGTLSGGQKRKLSVGIAMIGDSKVVILDEPSSGMDTSSRRRLWEMLKENKAGKILILTTHYMDEADILGDRICIMAEGRIKCCGSSLFLKNRYGVGYNLVIAKNSRDPAPQVDSFVFQNISNAQKLSEVSSEMTFQLPSESSSQFKQFFTDLDQNLSRLGITSYGVGITTLEEVFLRIAKDGEESEDSGEVKDAGSPGLVKSLENIYEEYSIAEEHETGFFNVFFQNLGVLIKKKFFLQVRDTRTLIIELVFPIIFIFAGLGLATIKPIRQGIARPLTPAIMPPSHLYFNNPIPAQMAPGTEMLDYFTEPFWGTERTQVQIDTSQKDNYTDMVSQFDNTLFEDRHKVNYGFYGDYFMYNLNETDPNEINYGAFALINATSQDAIAVYGAYIHQVLLRKMLKNPKLKLNLTFQPFPLTLLEQGVGSAAAGTAVSLMFAIAYMMVSDSLIQNIIRERQKMVKQQMIISGMSLPAYWMSHYILDIAFQAIPSICAIFGIHLFNLDFPSGWVIILIFIFVNPIFIYAFSCLFKSDASASIIIRLSYLVIGAILPVIIQFLLLFPSTESVGKVLRWVFYVLPIYALNSGLGNIASRQVIAVVLHKDLGNPLAWDVAGASVVFLLAGIPVYWFFVVLYEANACRCRRRQNIVEEQNVEREELLGSQFVENGVDEDITEEERRVAQADPKALTVMVNRVQKFYGKTQAVKKVSFGLEYGECFALLGVSGAGKTTTFKCLTGEEVPTIGDVRINGFDVTRKSGFDQARRLIGYCPQFDAIFDKLTVREHLQFYACVKGIKLSIRPQLIEKQIDEMDLREFENVHAERLSGGNKRKLSVAMALIGNPPIVFLDEPSTGVDPKAKRFMWTIVSKISTQRKKSSVIITTHSMEEAEALCTKMGIMVAGRFKCFGSSQHIKAKYGTGYEIEIKVKNLKEDEITELKEQLSLKPRQDRISRAEISQILQKLNAEYLEKEISQDGIGSDFHTELNSKQSVSTDEFIRWVFTETRGSAIVEKFENMFAQCEVLEHFNNSFKLKVSRDSYSIGYLFGMMEDIKGSFSISEYSVSQTTLEQIFNNFAKEAETNNARKRTTVARTLKKQDAVGTPGKSQQSSMAIRLKSEMRGNTEKLD